MSALKRYFETHLALKADQMRRAQEVSVSSHFSRNKAIRLSGWDFLKEQSLILTDLVLFVSVSVFLGLSDMVLLC